MLSIDLGIGLTSIAVAVRQATNYATTWSFAAYAQANGGALPGPWADVRRTGTATYENASGVITTLPDLGGGTYAARVQYRSGTARGLLIEGQTTNLWLNSATPATQSFTTTAQSYTLSVYGTVTITLSGTATGTLTATGAAGVRSTLTFTATAGTLTATVSGLTTGSKAQLEAGSAATSYVPTAGSAVVRAADSAGVFLTSSALSAAFPGGVGQPWTTVFQYIKGYSVSSDETLFALSAGSSAGSTNLLALQTNGTQAQAVHSGGSGTLSGTLVHDGATVNKVAVSVDPSAVGPELVTNGGFASSAGWTLPGVGTNAISGGVASLSGASGYLYRTGTAITSGKWYRVSFTVSGYSAGTVRPYIQASPVFGSNVSANGSHVQYLLATATSANTEIGFNVSGFSGSVDDLSITEVTAKMSISVNGAAAVETTGIAFTGSGTTHLIPGARTTGGSTPVLGMEIYDWRNVNTSYTTGASLQALSA